MLQNLRIRNWRLATKLGVSIVAVTIVIIGVTALIEGITTRAQLQTEISNSLSSIARSEGERIGADLDKQVSLVHTAVATDDDILDAVTQANAAYSGTTPEITDQLLAQDAQWVAAPETGNDLINQVLNHPVSNTLQEFLANSPNHLEIFITDYYGAVVATSNRTSDYYQADEEWWQTGFNNGQGLLTIGKPVYDDSAGALVLDIVAPIYNQQGELIGLVKDSYSLAAVEESLAAFELGSSGHEHLIDDQGEHLVASELGTESQATEAALTHASRQYSGVGSDFDVTDEGTATVLGYAPVTTNGRVQAVDDTGWYVEVLQDRAEALTILRQNNTIRLVSLAIAAVFVLGVAYWLARALTRQTDELDRLFRSVAVGDFAARAEVLSEDELGQAADGINRMLELLSDLLTGARAVADQRLAVLENTNDFVGIADIDGNVSYINPAGLAMIGRSDEDPTSMKIASVYAPESSARVMAEVLPLAIREGTWAGENSYLNRNGTTVPVSEVIMSIRDEAGEPVAIATIARNISDQKEVILNVEEAATHVTDASTSMADIVQLLVTQAANSAQVAEQAAISAHEGDQAVANTIFAMERIRDNTQESARRIKRLGEVSQEISEAVRLIEELADRTTVLALNASIQAAAAGDAGRGFAVVAEEVQRLAERATGATRQIEDLVKSIQAETNEAVVGIEEATREVVDGSQLAQEAGQQMARLNTLVNDLVNLIERVAETTATQTNESVTTLAELSHGLQLSVAGFGTVGGSQRRENGGNGSRVATL